MDKFEMPVIEVILLCAEDVITSSPIEPPYDPFE